jgi:hypothetical protein
MDKKIETTRKPLQGIAQEETNSGLIIAMIANEWNANIVYLQAIQSVPSLNDACIYKRIKSPTCHSIFCKYLTKIGPGRSQSRVSLSIPTDTSLSLCPVNILVAIFFYFYKTIFTMLSAHSIVTTSLGTTFLL